MDNQITLEWAIHYAEHGYRVIPIKPNEKRPPIAAWQDHATTNTGVITKWFTQTYPDHGIGIVTGWNDHGHRFIALDIDTKPVDGKAFETGQTTIDRLEQQHGTLPATVEARTGSGGRHLLYRLADRHPMPNNGSGRYLGGGVDVRGQNAQIVVAPTVHPNGQQYRWEDGHAIGEIEPAEAPDWLIELLTPPEYQPEPSKPKEAKGEATENNGDTRVGTRFNRETNWDDLLLADGWQPHHQQGDTYHWTRPAKSTRDGISATVNYNNNDLLTVFTTAIHNLPAGTYDRFGYWVTTRYQGDFTAAARDLARDQQNNLQHDIRQWIQRIQTQTEQQPLQIEPQDDHTPKLDSWLIKWPDFWNSNSDDTEWLVEPVLAKTRGHALFAGAKSGKSLMLLEIAAALATGKPVLNQPAQPPIHVLYIDYEMSAQDVRDRLEAFGYGNSDNLDHLHYALLPSIGGLDTPEGAQTIIDAVHHHNIELVVIDTTARAVEGAENDADTLRAFYRWTGLALKAKGCTYVRADHAGKDQAKGQRGTSAKNDDVDVVWKFTKRQENNIVLEATHRRMSWVPERTEIELVETTDGLRHRVVQDKPSAAASVLAAKLAGIGVGIDTTLAETRKLIKQHEIKCAQDTLRAALKLVKADLERAAVQRFAGGSETAPLTTSRTFEDETRLDQRLEPSDPETTRRLGSVSPRLDTASDKTDETHSIVRLVVSPDPDDPQEHPSGLF